MLRKEDVIKMLEDWKAAIGNDGVSEIAEVVIDLAINKIAAMEEVAVIASVPPLNITVVKGD